MKKIFGVAALLTLSLQTFAQTKELKSNDVISDLMRSNNCALKVLRRPIEIGRLSDRAVSGDVVFTVKNVDRMSYRYIKVDSSISMVASENKSIILFDKDLATMEVYDRQKGAKSSVLNLTVEQVYQLSGENLEVICKRRGFIGY